ncbi:MAG: ATP-binding protein, partial [Thiohalomonadaceae bacterium]
DFFGVKSTAQKHKGWMNQILEENPVPTLWLTNAAGHIDPAFMRRFDMVFELPIPPRRQREKIIQSIGNGILPEESIARIASIDNLSPAVFERANRVVSTIRDTLGEKAIPSAMEHLLNNTLKAQGRRPISKVDPNALPAWYDPGFINCEMDLSDLADGLASHKSGRVCLYGPPGTGKTAFGRWLADRLELPLTVKRASDLISMWVGETEKNIAAAFSEAEQEGALLLIDEVDSFLQDRRGATNSWEVTAVNEMLTQMEGFPGLFIASTNLMDGLDQASLRRFDLKLNFRYLNAQQAWGMFCQQAHSLGLEIPDSKLQSLLSRLEILTPGDFAAVARQHRFRPLGSAEAMLKALEEECLVKAEGKTRRIGFV